MLTAVRSSSHRRRIRQRYLLEDNFGGAAIDTGLWTVTDTESKISVSGGNLVFAGGKASPAWADPRLVDGAWQRVAGLTLECDWTPGEVGFDQAFLLSKALNATYNSGAGFEVYSTLYAGDTLSDVEAERYFVAVPFAMSVGTTYRLRIVIGADYARWYISKNGGLAYSLVWVGSAGAQTVLYPALMVYNKAATIADALVYRGSPKPPVISATPAATVPAVATTGGPLNDGELLTNGSFTAWTGDNPDGWTVTGESGVDPMVTEVAGAARLYTSAVEIRISQDVGTVGQWVRMSLDVTARVSSGIVRRFGTGQPGIAYSTPATYINTGRFTVDGVFILVRNSNPTDITLDNVSLKPFILSSLLSGDYDAATRYGVFDAAVTAASGQAGIVCCLDSASSPLYGLFGYVDRNDAKAKLYKLVNGTLTDLTSGDITYAAGAQLRLVIVPGSSGLSNAGISMYYGGTLVGTAQTVDLSSFGTLVRAFDTSGAATVAIEVNLGLGQ